MAVEIPVIVDIYGGINDAIKNQLPRAVSDLENAVKKNPVRANITIGNLDNTNEQLKKMREYYKQLEDADWKRVGQKLDLTPFVNQAIMELRKLEKEINEIQELRQMEGGGGDFSFSEEYKRLNDRVVSVTNSIRALQTTQEKLNSSSSGAVFQEHIKSLTSSNAELAKMREYYSQLEDYSVKYASSINAIRDRIADLNAQWNAMTKAQRKGEEGRAVYEKFKKETKELKEEALALDEVLRKEQQRQELAKRGAQSRRYENAILNSNVESIRVLQEQERILSDRLNRTKIGSSKYKQLEKQLEGVREKLKDVTGTVETTTVAMNRQGAVLRSLASYASMYFSVFGLIRFAKQIRDVTGELEYQQIALGHLIQDEEYGAKLFEDIKQAALKSPFQIKDLVTYTKQLAAYRIEQENLFETTSRLADISAGLGVDMNRLILAYGQVRSASVLRGQELRQFTEAGIPLVELLAEKMGELHNTTYRTADVFKLISDRAVPFSAIASIFEDLTEKGGMFYKMQEEQADTLKGRWEKLKDAFTVGLQAAGETNTFLWQNNLLINTLTVLAKNIRFVPKIIESLGVAWATYSIAAGVANLRNKQLAKSSIEVMTAKQLMSAGVSKASIRLLGYAATTKLVTKANRVLAGSNTLVSRSFAKLTLALLKNPYLAIAAAVASIISALVLWRKKNKEVEESFRDLTEAIENVSESEKQYKRMQKQIDAYERLASKTERTAKENVELANTLGVLREAFPGVALTVDETNESLSTTVALLKDLNEKNQIEGMKKAFRAREIAQDKAEELSGSIAKLTKEQDSAWAKYETKREAGDEKGAKKAREEYEKIGDQLDKNNKEYVQTLKYIQALDKYLSPDKDSGLAVWQKTMMSMKDFSVDGKSFNLIGEGDIEGYDSLYKGLKAIDKIYQDATESAKEMKAALSSVSEEYKEDAEEEIRIEEARRDAAKAILDTFGYVSKIDQKKDTSSLAILKEELKNVQDIYKRYKEFLKYMTVDEAQKKIKEIYGSVTAIDFLSPETYKKRLANLLSELRALQGRVKVGAKKLTADMASDLKEMLRGDEGFRSKAYKLKGEKAYTIGYGFYNQLTDGRKVVEGMTMTMDEAEAELDRQVQRTANTTSKLIEQYGKGIQLTERQFNILANLAYQGPATLKRALQEANGDANKLADALENAAWPYVAKPHQAAVKNRDMRRALMFRLAGATNDEEAKELQSTIFDLEKIVQDVDWDELEDSIEKRLKKISDDLKKSETARNFYKNILDITGDEDLATNMTVSIYGGLGNDFKERIQEELYRALTELEPGTIDSDLMTQLKGDITVFDVDDILKNMDKLPPKVKDVFQKVLGEVQDHEADLMKFFADLVAKYGDTAQKISTINAKANNDIQKVKDALELSLKDTKLTPEQRKALKDRADEIIKALEATRDLDIFKQSDKYIDFFAEINLMTAEEAATVRGELRNAFFKAFHDGAISADELRKNLRAVDEQFRKLSESTTLLGAYLSGGFDGATKKLQEYSNTVSVLAAKMEAGKELNESEQKFATRMLGMFGGDVTKNAKSYAELIEAFSNSGGLEKAGEAFGQMGDGMSAMAANGPGALAIVDAIIKAVHGTISGIQQVIDQLNEMRSEENKVGDWFKYVSDFDKYAFSGWEKLKSGDAIGATADAIGSVISIFNNVQRDKVKKFNEQIKEQTELIDELEYQYDRINAAMEKSFGSDYIYNYNKQLEMLNAQAEAYRKQAEAERAKGKSADEDTALGFEKSAREIEDQIEDMKTRLSEFFSGTDLTSAAEDFANAWIEAYKEFGSTADAMSEKFNDMINSMINRSLAARIMQEMLQPIFDQIDALSKDGILATDEIASIAALAQERIPMINQAMTNLMTSLASAGLDVRTSTAGFKGISRDIAGASEESILGLAAGINTQNFYMSYMPIINENVAAILATLTGEVGDGPRRSPANMGEVGDGPRRSPANMGEEDVMPSVQQMVYDHLPDMHIQLSNIAIMLRSVITTKNSTTNTNYVAVK